MFFRILQHLLPKSRAFQVVTSKLLRGLFVALGNVNQEIKEEIDKSYLDNFSQETRFLDEWERQYAIRASQLNEQQRRDRLEETKKAEKGLSPKLIEEKIRGAGFDVYLHEWWEPESSPLVVRDPKDHIRRFANKTVYLTECGAESAEAGNPDMVCGSSIDPQGYPLVNRILTTQKDLISSCGNQEMECGSTVAIAGSFTGYGVQEKEYYLPIEAESHSSFIYVGAEEFGKVARVEASRKEELEELCLKYCPAHLWIGMLVSYS